MLDSPKSGSGANAVGWNGAGIGFTMTCGETIGETDGDTVTPAGWEVAAPEAGLDQRVRVCSFTSEVMSLATSSSCCTF